MVFDAQRQRLLYVGCSDEGTFEWDGADWVLRAVHSPLSWLPGVAYDEARHNTVMFTVAGYQTGATWTWDGSAWSFRTNQGPVPRLNPAIAYDSARGVVVMFGGAPTAGSFGGSDTWEWDGTRWTQRQPPVVPTPFRFDSAMAYDPTRQRCVLFGGEATQYTDDTWEYDGNTWVLASPGAGPVRRTRHSMAYDSIAQRVVLFGGYGPGGINDTNTVLNDMWLWDGRTWTRRPVPGAPARQLAAMAFDPVVGRLVLSHGASNQGALSDTSELSEESGPPWLQSQSSDLVAAVGATLRLEVAAGGTGPLTYVWRHGGSVLTDDTRISGAGTPSLTIASLGRSDTGLYDAVVTGPCGSFVTRPIRLRGVCPADFDGDGTANVADYLAFLRAFSAGDAAADLSGDGVVSVVDYLAFLTEYAAGCT
jgi:hypothetical protein